MTEKTFLVQEFVHILGSARWVTISSHATVCDALALLDSVTVNTGKVYKNEIDYHADHVVRIVQVLEERSKLSS